VLDVDLRAMFRANKDSFFGDQEGEFSLTVKSIKAVSQSLDLEGGMSHNVRQVNAKL
jgi:hypothetical protein